MIVFFNDTATTEIYTLSLHDALPIFRRRQAPQAPRDERGQGERDGDGPPVAQGGHGGREGLPRRRARPRARGRGGDRKSTRLNSSHANISYAVFCLKKKILPTRLSLD